MIDYNDESYLMHYGVLGMKWGVRNAETLRKYANEGGSKPTKRQVKSAVRYAKRSHRKDTGEWFTTGANMSKVNKKRDKAIRNDKTLAKLEESQSVTEKLINKEMDKIDKRDQLKDHLRRLQTDPLASTDMRRNVEKEYLVAKEKAKKANDKIYKLEEEYNNYMVAYDTRLKSISKRYLNEYKDSMVKDLGINNTEKGKKLLEEYGIFNSLARDTTRGIFR